jgi:hypothetical protein
LGDARERVAFAKQYFAHSETDENYASDTRVRASLRPI